MRAFVILLALYLSAGAAAAQTNQEMIWAMGEVGEELQVCSIYFTVTSGCLERQEPATSKKYMQEAERLALLGLSSKQSAASVLRSTAICQLNFDHCRSFRQPKARSKAGLLL